MKQTTQRSRYLRLFSALATVMLASGCSSSTTAPASSSSSAAQNGEQLIVASDLTYPPYAYMNNQTPSGFDVDISKAIAKKMGKNASFADTRFAQLIPTLQSGHADMIASALYITSERAKQVDYIPYFMTGNSIVVRKNATKLSKVTDLCGLKVGVIKGGDIVDKLKNDGSSQCKTSGKPEITVMEFPTDPEATQALISRQVDAQVTDAAVASSVVKETAGKVEISSSDLLYAVPVGLAVKKGNTKLKNNITKALTQMEEDGSYQKILKQYNLQKPDNTAVKKALSEQ